MEWLALLKDVPTSILAIGTGFVVAMLLLAWQLWLYGGALKTLSQVRTLAEMSSLVSDMGRIRNEFGGLSADVKKLFQDLDAIKRSSSAVERDVIDIQDTVSAGSDDKWKQISSAWRQARDQIEGIIDGDKEASEEMADVRRNKYDPIIDKLVSMRLLKNGPADNLKSMERVYLAHRNKKKEITEVVLRGFNAAFDALKKSGFF